jgi:hypothetical protein
MLFAAYKRSFILGETPLSMSISGAYSPYAAYNYSPPQPPDFSDISDEGMDFGVEDMVPADQVAQVLPVQNQEQMAAVQPTENARGSDQDSFRREHSTTQRDLREIQAVMMGFSTKRALELQNGFIASEI